ncbi:amidohydrolase family protein [Neorhizobium galegae]|uniref:amidohydrolase family protein n=1 Tax=Neorhizobium galegae TaxID=399 RepID=UPI0006224268|nr:amidohydrolase family protein [Neorhizobium galegae]MCQ1765545.1 amidohydrolase family protein [Neorhizobium galegae]MCQ1844459.1 amidohydrolase family protein [Neorhizobium galegae]CDZ32983.1 2-pyrone-4,6-dicarboxylic acid hydrolase [Neorhizobium galegae bv. officinalis]
MLVRTLSGTPPKTKLPKGAIDTQMHAYLPGFPSLPGGPGLPAGDLPTPAQYLEFMRWIGIDRVIVTQGNAQQRDNSNLNACLAEFGSIARGVCVIDSTTSEAELDSLAAAGNVGARIMDLPGGAVNLSELEAVDAKAASRNWMVAVQFDGSNILDHEERLKNLKSRWVFDHHGKFFAGVTPDSPQVDAVKRLIDGGKCWFKFAGVYESSKAGGPDYADVAAVAREIARYAPERIVWGTNWPHNLAREQADYPDDAALTDTVLGWLPDDAARELALVKNPEELYGLPAR